MFTFLPPCCHPVVFLPTFCHPLVVLFVILPFCHISVTPSFFMSPFCHFFCHIYVTLLSPFCPPCWFICHVSVTILSPFCHPSVTLLSPCCYLSATLLLNVYGGCPNNGVDATGAGQGDPSFFPFRTHGHRTCPHGPWQLEARGYTIRNVVSTSVLLEWLLVV